MGVTIEFNTDQTELTIKEGENKFLFIKEK